MTFILFSSFELKINLNSVKSIIFFWFLATSITTVNKQWDITAASNFSKWFKSNQLIFFTKEDKEPGREIVNENIELFLLSFWVFFLMERVDIPDKAYYLMAMRPLLSSHYYPFRSKQFLSKSTPDSKKAILFSYRPIHSVEREMSVKRKSERLRRYDLCCVERKP